MKWGYLVSALIALGTLGVVAWDRWCEHEEMMAEAEREQFERIMRASPPRAPGFESRRIS